MKYNQNVKDILLPQYVLWIALIISIIIQNITYIYFVGSIYHFSLNQYEILFLVFCLASFLFSFLFSSRFKDIIKSVDVNKTPLLKNLSPQEKDHLKYYSKYLFYLLACWIIIDLCVIFSFVLSQMSNNYFLLNLVSIGGLYMNIVVLKPNYHLFLLKKEQSEK